MSRRRAAHITSAVPRQAAHCKNPRQRIDAASVKNGDFDASRPCNWLKRHDPRLASALLKPGSMKTSIAAAALALLSSFAANAGGLKSTFQVGAVVVASASVSSQLTRTSVRDGIDVRTGGYRPPKAALLLDGQVTPIPDPKGASIAAPAGAEAVVTVVY
jgi:hypothetical protein